MHIKINAANEIHSLGKPIRIDVVMMNPGDCALVLDEPATSLAVEFHLIDRQTKEDLSYTMGRVTTTAFGAGTDQYALVVPLPKRIEIAPRASFVFSTDPNQRLFLRAGVFEGFLTADGAESNHIELAIEFTRGSVHEMFSLARNPEQEYGRREWAMDWLGRLYPGFRLALPTPEASASNRAQMEAANRPVYEAFVAWWRENEHQLDEMLRRLR